MGLVQKRVCKAKQMTLNACTEQQAEYSQRNAKIQSKNWMRE